MIPILRLLTQATITEQEIQSVVADLEDLDRCGVGGAFYLNTILPRSYVKVWSLGPWVIYQDRAGRWKYTPLPDTESRSPSLHLVLGLL